MKPTLYFLKTVVMCAVMLAGASHVSAQTWSAPTDAPPNGNVNIPVHQGLAPQLKDGKFMSTPGLWSGKVVISPALCLGMEPDVVNSFVTEDMTNITCIQSWDEIGGDLALPQGANFQTLYFDPTDTAWKAGSAVQVFAGTTPDSVTNGWVRIGQPLGELPNSTNTIGSILERARVFIELGTTTAENRVKLDADGVTIDQGNPDKAVEIKAHQLKIKFYDGASTVETTTSGADTPDPGYGSALPGDYLGLSNDGAGEMSVKYMPAPYISGNTLYVWNELTDSFDSVAVGSGGGSGGSGCSPFAVMTNPQTGVLSLVCGTNYIPLSNLGGGTAISAGTVPGATLAWNSTTNTWQQNRWLRTSNGESPSLHIGSAPSEAFNGNDNINDNWNNNPATPAIVAIYGDLSYRQAGDLTDSTGKILGALDNVGGVGWVDPATYLNEVVPQGDSQGQMLYWNIAEGGSGQWSLTDGIVGGENRLTLIGDGTAGLNIAAGAQLQFVDSDFCPEGSGDGILKVEQNIFDTGIQKVICSTAIRIKNYGDPNYNEIFLSNVPILAEPNNTLSQPRQLCYTSTPIPGIVDKNMLIDCAAASAGSVFLPGPKFSVNTLGYPNDTLETQTNAGGYIGTLLATNQFKYEWEVPFGVTSVNVKGCGGGGGGGGGAGGQPGIDDKPGGGGGGGGAAGGCTAINGIDIELTGVTKLVFEVGAGGKRGIYGQVCVTGSTSCDRNVTEIGGGSGSQTIIKKYNGTTLIGTVATLSGGAGGAGGKRRSESNFSGFQNAGGVGGKGGATPLNADPDGDFTGHNGSTARDNETNTIQNLYSYIGYHSSISSGNISRGGDGGAGQSQIFPIPSGAVYGAFSNPGAGGSGSSANSDSQGNGSNLFGGVGGHGTWASGGGGGGGASAFDWADTCSFPVPSYSDVGDFTSSPPGDDCNINFGGENESEGSNNQMYWFSRGGRAGHGGPGFVTLSW